MNNMYICIDLKSYFASVECVLRNLDPLNTNLVVADNSRTDKTVCLAITPSLKKYGLSGRARLYEVKSKIRKINEERKINTDNYIFYGKSFIDSELEDNDNLELDYIIAPPRMAYYMKYSVKIYNIYLKYVSKDDIYSYSIDEVFIDITSYLNYYKKSARDIATMMIKEVYDTTGITATAGVGTNMYLAKIAMDIMAKKSKPNSFGVRIASLDEISYRKKLWEHTPITDFWRVGKGYAKRLSKYNLYTMGDIAKFSLSNEDELYKEFGVNAELLIDHAWGYEPVLLSDVKNVKPKEKSISSGQVLHTPYDYEMTKLIIKEMTELLSLELVKKGVVTDMVVLHISYDIENITNPLYINYYNEVTTDFYGRTVPKPAHGTIRLYNKTASTKLLMEHTLSLYENIINKKLVIGKVNITFGNLSKKSTYKDKVVNNQLNIFENYDNLDKDIENMKHYLTNEEKVQEVVLDIKRRFGKNSILKGMNLLNGATTIDRNNQIGGHKA